MTLSPRVWRKPLDVVRTPYYTVIMDIATELREQLLVALREANADVKRRKDIYIAPFSGHDAMVNFHEARGVCMGLAKAVETIDRFEP